MHVRIGLLSPEVLVLTGIVGTLDHQITTKSTLELASKAGANNVTHVSGLSCATSEDQGSSLAGGS